MVDEKEEIKELELQAVDGEKDDLSGQVMDLKNHISKLNEENKKHRLRFKDEQGQREAALTEQGQYKALAESLQERLDGIEKTLPSLKEKAERFDVWSQREADHIEKRLASVPDSWRTVVERAPNLETKRDILAALDQSKNNPVPGATASAPSNANAEHDPKEIARTFLKQRQNGQVGRKGLFSKD